MRAANVLRVLSCVSLLSGCGVVSDLLGEEEPPAPPPPAPITPVEAQPPAKPQPRAGGFTLPGLDGFSIPIPRPDPDVPDPTPPARGSLAAPPTGSTDARGHLTPAFLAARAEAIHRALLDSLDAHEREQTRAIPFEVVDDREPNAAAACSRGRTPLMMITSAMLELAAGIAEAKAYDEIAGTDTYEAYVRAVIDEIRSQRPIPGIDPRLHTAPHATDAHKLARQLHLYDQQIAFIIGHELAHHYRGHTNCVSGRTEAEIQRDELAQLLAHTVPPFSQPREVEADMWGVVNVLEAGRERSGGTWTHEGALLNLDFFRRLRDLAGAELVLAFLSTHPPALVRIPIVRAAAQQWQPDWRPPAMPTLDDIALPGPNGPIRLPNELPIDPSQLPIDPSQLPIDPSQLPIDPSQLPIPIPIRRVE